MHQLYTRPDTGGFAVHAALEQSGVEYNIVAIDKSQGHHESAEFMHMSPLGQVPILKLPDGTAMTESAAMMLYLADLNPDAGLSPAPGSPLRPHYLRWMVFCAANLYMTDLRYYYPDRHTSDPAGGDAVKAQALVDLERQYRMLDQAIGDGSYLQGETWTAADIYATMMAHWHPDVPVMFAACPNLARMCLNIGKLDCVRKANEYHQNL